MTVLSVRERQELLAQSSYGAAGAKSTKKRKTGFRSVNSLSLEKTNGRPSLKQFKVAASQSVIKASESNIHRREIERLEANPELINKDREYFEQTLFFAEVYDLYPQYYPALCAVPNGGFRLKAERWRLSASGQKAGWPDTQLMLASLGFYGLFIEFKKPFDCYKSLSEARGAVKPHQVATLRMLNSQGYAGRVAFGYLEAMQIFEAYVGVKGDLNSLILFYPADALHCA